MTSRDLRKLNRILWYAQYLFEREGAYMKTINAIEGTSVVASGEISPERSTPIRRFLAKSFEKLRSDGLAVVEVKFYSTCVDILCVTRNSDEFFQKCEGFLPLQVLFNGDTIRFKVRLRRTKQVSKSRWIEKKN